MAHILVQRGEHATILRVSDGGRSFSGNAVHMHNLFRRLQAMEPEVSRLVERRLKTHNNGAPWQKYQKWLESHSTVSPE